MDRGAWQATVNGIQRVGQEEVTNTFVFSKTYCIAQGTLNSILCNN